MAQAELDSQRNDWTIFSEFVEHIFETSGSKGAQTELKMIPSFACYPISISQKRDLFSALLGREKIPCYHLNSQTTHVPCLCKYCSCNTLTRITEVLPSQPTFPPDITHGFGVKLQEVFAESSTRASHQPAPLCLLSLLLLILFIAFSIMLSIQIY